MAEVVKRLALANDNDQRQLGSPRRLPDDGGGGHDGGMPPELPERVAVLETHIGHINRNVDTIQKDVRELRADIKSEFRLTWAALFAVALGLAGIMAKGFKWI